MCILNATNSQRSFCCLPAGSEKGVDLRNAVPRSLLALTERLIGPTCWFGLTQEQQTGKNQCSSKGKGVHRGRQRVARTLWNPALISSAAFCLNTFCKVLEFSVTESYRVECKLGSVRVKKKKATCFYTGIKSILLSNPVCFLLPWISCGCGCQRGKES